MPQYIWYSCVVDVFITITMLWWKSILFENVCWKLFIILIRVIHFLACNYTYKASIFKAIFTCSALLLGGWTGEAIRWSNFLSKTNFIRFDLSPRKYSSTLDFLLCAPAFKACILVVFLFVCVHFTVASEKMFGYCVRLQ